MYCRYIRMHVRCTIFALAYIVIFWGTLIGPVGARGNFLAKNIHKKKSTNKSSIKYKIPKKQEPPFSFLALRCVSGRPCRLSQSQDIGVGVLDQGAPKTKNKTNKGSGGGSARCTTHDVRCAISPLIKRAFDDQRRASQTTGGASLYGLMSKQPFKDRAPPSPTPSRRSPPRCTTFALQQEPLPPLAGTPDTSCTPHAPSRS